MGIGTTELTLAQLAAYRYQNVNFVNVPGGSLLYTVVGHPNLVVINLGEFLNIADGEIQGDAIAIDELTATQIGDSAIHGRELAATPSLFHTPTATVTHDHTDNAGVTLLAANAAGGGDRLVLVQCTVTEAFVTASWEINVGSGATLDGLFNDIFDGVAALAIDETVVGAYLLPEGEALVTTEVSMVTDTAGILSFAVIVMTPAAGSIPGDLLANDAVGLFENVAAVNVAFGDASPVEILARDATNDRLCLIMGIATITAVGTPDYDVGSETTAINAAFDQLSAGTWVKGERWVGACMLPAGESLDVTITGGGSAGAVDFYVIPITVVAGGAAALDGLFVGGTNFEQDHGTGAGTILAANAAGEGDRLVVVQAMVTEAWAGTSWELQVGSTTTPNGLFADIFGGDITLAVGKSVIGTYLLPEEEPLAVVETDMNMTAGKIMFRILVNAPADGSIPGLRLANDAVYFPFGVAPVNVDWEGGSPIELLASDANNNRHVIVMAIATETAVGTPDYDIGVAGGSEVFNNLAAGAWVEGERWFGACDLPAGSALQATVIAGGSSAGTIAFYVFAYTPLVETDQITNAAVTGVKIANDAVNFPDVITPTNVAHTDAGAKEILALDATQDRIVLVTAIVTVSAEAGVCDWDVGAVAGAEVFNNLAAGNWEVGDRYFGAMLLLQDEALNVTLQTAGSQGAIDFYVTELFITVRTAQVYDDAITDAKLASEIVKDEGAIATGLLRVTGVIVDGEDITIGADDFAADQIDNVSGDTCDGNDFNVITDPLLVAMPVGTYTNIGQGGVTPLVVGALIYIGTEYLRVTIVDGDNVTFARGQCNGGAAAAHVGTTAIFDSAATEAPAKICVGHQAGGDLAAAVHVPAFAATINEAATEDVSAVDAQADGTELLVVANAVGVVTLATTDGHGNAVWDDANMRRGAAPAVRKTYSVQIDCDTEEANANLLYVPIPFTPALIFVNVLVSATGLRKAWVGEVELRAAAGAMPAFLELNNAGAVNYDANDDIHILCIE